jgi:hypothetical protein
MLKANKVSPYSKPRYDRSDLDMSHNIRGKGYRMDHESGLYYPEEEMEQGADGNWYLRGNIDADMTGYPYPK